MERIHGIVFVLALCATLADAQNSNTVDVRMQLVSPSKAKHPAPPAVIWLKPLAQIPPAPTSLDEQYTLLQKNRMFTPHLMVIPVGSVVRFPNADPFFHNVFSLFDGKRFDLGLYEAGSTKEVTFSREGVSYIFCNIHPQMSAVVLSLSTRFYAIADTSGAFHLPNVPAGEYELHVWVEGVPQPALSQFARRLRLTVGTGDLGSLNVVAIEQGKEHLNKFGQAYNRDETSPY